jgi:hypothetical protein
MRWKMVHWMKTMRELPKLELELFRIGTQESDCRFAVVNVDRESCFAA